MIATRASIAVAACAVACATTAGARVVAANDDRGPRCRHVRAEMVEDLVTEGCKPGETSCFVGEVWGRGLRGTTHFKGDSQAPGPSKSPGWISYSGLFEYTTERGTILLRETGVVNQTQGNLESGAVTAMQLIIGGTGAYDGATGYLFVSGFNLGGHVETDVSGTICRPER